jgi:DNA-binding transcriptional ArsR family regulator
MVFNYLFYSKYAENLLFYLLINDNGYATALSAIFGVSLSVMQNTLKRLEKGGILVSSIQGKTRMYRFNPRYPLLKEFKALLERAYAFLPDPIKETYYEIKTRKRPRRTGKPLFT